MVMWLLKGYGRPFVIRVPVAAVVMGVGHAVVVVVVLPLMVGGERVAGVGFWGTAAPKLVPPERRPAFMEVVVGRSATTPITITITISVAISITTGDSAKEAQAGPASAVRGRRAAARRAGTFVRWRAE